MVLNIAGIFQLGVRELDSRYVYVDLKQAQSLLDLPGGVTVIDLRVDELFTADAIAAHVRALTGLKAESWLETNTQLVNALQSQSLSTAMISFFVALSVAFGIASVLSISVVQRTREIGILRAMGAPRRQMLRVFLVQGGVLGFLGAGIGAGAGWGLVWVFNTFGPKLFYIPVSPLLVPAAMLLATRHRHRLGGGAGAARRAPGPGGGHPLCLKCCAWRTCASPTTSACPPRPRCCMASRSRWRAGTSRRWWAHPARARARC